MRDQARDADRVLERDSARGRATARSTTATPRAFASPNSSPSLPVCGPVMSSGSIRARSKRAHESSAVLLRAADDQARDHVDDPDGGHAGSAVRARRRARLRRPRASVTPNAPARTSSGRVRRGGRPARAGPRDRARAGARSRPPGQERPRRGPSTRGIRRPSRSRCPDDVGRDRPARRASSPRAPRCRTVSTGSARSARPRPRRARARPRASRGTRRGR